MYTQMCQTIRSAGSVRSLPSAASGHAPRSVTAVLREEPPLLTFCVHTSINQVIEKLGLDKTNYISYNTN